MYEKKAVKYYDASKCVNNVLIFRGTALKESIKRFRGARERQIPREKESEREIGGKEKDSNI